MMCKDVKNKTDMPLIEVQTTLDHHRNELVAVVLARFRRSLHAR
jgi:hypothetical protein